MNKLVMVSGGFDPIHAGHIKMIREAAKLGEVIVALNSDEWLIRKKGFRLQSWADRQAVLDSIKGVAEVFCFDDSDGTACEALSYVIPDIFANGGDRGPDNTPEAALCEKLGIKTVYGLGAKTHSSSQIATQATVRRDWGTYTVILDRPGMRVKELILAPQSHTSVQKHKHRDEMWYFEDHFEFIPRGQWHQLRNDTEQTMHVLEVQLGMPIEDDITRMPPQASVGAIKE